jgi:hypothetical protein
VRAGELLVILAKYFISSVQLKRQKYRGPNEKKILSLDVEFVATDFSL